MRKWGWGRIINCASAHGLSASANKSAYVAAKHGVIGLTKVTALETAGRGITCNDICPGWVLTQLAKQQIDDHAAPPGQRPEEPQPDTVAAETPSQAFPTPPQIGGRAHFPISPHPP